jgi:hypothetical protein
MDAHKQKAAWLSWREFLKEYVLIVVGVLTALGAGQLVEEFSWSERVAGAEAAMRSELRQNDRDAYFLLAIAPCKTAKLDEIKRALIASHDHGAPVPAIEPYQTERRPWSTDAWESARALQIVGHIPNDRLQLYSFAYVFPVGVRQSTEREVAAKSALNTLAINHGQLQPAERDRLFQALVAAQDTLHGLDNAAMYLLSATKPLGLQLSQDEEASELRNARADWGACATRPTLVDVAPDRRPL